MNVSTYLDAVVASLLGHLSIFYCMEKQVSEDGLEPKMFRINVVVDVYAGLYFYKMSHDEDDQNP